MILITPISFSALKLIPLPFLIAETLASKIGGTATLIGDPPNILIGSAAGFDFLTFALNMAPIAAIILSVFLGLSWILFKNDLQISQETNSDIEALELSELITDKPLLLKALIIMGFVLFGFLLHGALHLEPATIALAGAAILLLWSRSNLEHVLRELEWTTLFFFIGLFIVVEAIVEVGIVEAASQALLNLTNGSLITTPLLILWMSTIASGVVDNIPYTATMIPIVENMGEIMPLEPLWRALALGACLGGNATLVGASANIVVANLAARSGYPISFKLFFRYGFFTTLLSLLLASLYVWIRYLL
jgi:Na+/H+ antiporter NhaD/arsenite permease-like protein